MHRSSRPNVFLRKRVLNICRKFTGEHPCRSAISIKCNIVELHPPDHTVVEPHANILCANLFHLCFSFSKIVVHCLKYWLSTRWLYSSWMKMRTRKPLQRKLENIVLDPGWEIDNCLDVILYYSTIRNIVQKMKFSIKDFFSKCDQIRKILNPIFCAVKRDTKAFKEFRKMEESQYSI